MPHPLKSARALFQEAAEMTDPASRARFLSDACSDDSELQRHVEALLRVHDEPDSLLDQERIPAQVLIGRQGDDSTFDQPVERPGTQIGPYKLLQQIGEGGFGIVFMAEQLEPVRRKVALKVIKPGMDTRQVIARFEAERQALAVMDHPNIAKVFDAGTTGGGARDQGPGIGNRTELHVPTPDSRLLTPGAGRPYFVMELVRGTPITQYCDENQLPIRERLQLFATVCLAIQHAHTKGIIHRDIKPTNVLVTRQDGQPIVKVIDFGVAKAMGQQLTEKTLFTEFAQMIGTPLYMSPEQAELSSVDIDTRSDIYSLGVLLYELLTGSTPVSKEQLKQAEFDEIRRIIREDEPPKPSTRISTLGPTAVTTSAHRQSDPQKLRQLLRGELDWIVMKAVEKDRSRRYETASAFAADVQRYLRDEPVEACPPSAWYRFRKFARRHKRGLLTATVIALAVLLSAAVSGVLIWHKNQDLHQALESELHGAYLQRIALAEREWAANNLGRMEELLAQCPADLRDWEWRYLKRLRYGALAPLRHESGVYHVTFSRDGKYLATSTKEGIVRICRATTGEELRQWKAHEDNATCVEFSPNSQYLASGGWDRTVKVWDVQMVLRGEVPAPLFRLELTDPVLRVWGVSFSPDSQRLAFAGGREAENKGELKVWDMNTRQEVFALSLTRGLRCVQFSPDGRRLATCGQDMVQVWDAQTGREQLAWNDPQGLVDQVAFSPDGRRLAAVGGTFAVQPNREVKVWDAQTGQEILSLRGHVGALRGVAFSPDGRRIASAGLDQTIKLWDATSGQEVLTLRGHIDNVFGVAFSPDGHRLASACTDETVRIWDASPPVEQEPGPEYLTLRGHTGAVTDVAFHPTDERTLASAGADGTVRVWDLWSGKPVSTLTGTPSAIRLRLAYSPDGQRLAVVSGAQKEVTIWDVATAKVISNIPGHTANALCVAFSPDGWHVASASWDFVVQVCDATTGQEVHSQTDHSWTIHGVAFSPDGRQVASCSADRTVRVWDWTTGQASLVLEPRHSSRVANVAFSRDGKLLASAGWDRTVKVWDTEKWKLLHDLHDSPGAAAQCVAFGPDQRLAWGSTDGTVKVWDGPGTETRVLRGHTSWVQAVAFSRDGKWIASASLDGTVKVWKSPPEPEATAPMKPVQDQSGGRSSVED